MVGIKKSNNCFSWSHICLGCNNEWLKINFKHIKLLNIEILYMVKNKTRKKRKTIKRKTIKSKIRTLKSYSPTINKQFLSLKDDIKLQKLTSSPHHVPSLPRVVSQKL